MPITAPDNTAAPDVLAVVAAHDEADRIAATIEGLGRAFPGAPVWVADDGSTDATAAFARSAGAEVVGVGARRGPLGKGGAMTLAVRAALAGVGFGEEFGEEGAERARARARALSHSNLNNKSPALAPVVVLCDGDLGTSAGDLGPLVDAVRAGGADVAVAAFSTRAGGGFGVALAFARWAVRRRCGLSLRAPLSGQRALRADVLADVMPFAGGYGMEPAMAIDAARAGRTVVEVELSLTHRPTGRGLGGFAHRGRQLCAFVRVYLSRG